MPIKPINQTTVRQASGAKASEFSIIPIHEKIIGYRNREDISTLPANTLVVGSKDVLTNTFGRVFSRAGYTMDGTQESADIGIVSFFDWFTPHGGGVRNLRAGFKAGDADGKLQMRYVDPNGNVKWYDILTSLTSVNFNFTEWWNNTQQITELLMVNRGQQIYDWTGAIATVSTTSDSASAVMSIAANPTAGGTGYVVGDVLTISGGTGATATVGSVLNGVVSGISLVDGGWGYSGSDVIALGSASGINGTVFVNTVNGNGTITAFTLQNGGQNYTTGRSYATGGTLYGAVFTITSVSTGVIGTDVLSSNSVPLTLNTAGHGYTTGSGKATTGGSGSGATVQILTLSSNTITIEGTKTVGQLGFYNNTGTHKLMVKGQVFSYLSSTANANSQTFLGISPDPTTAGLSAGDLIIQVPEVTANAGGSSGLPVSSSTSFANWTNDLIAYSKGQVLVGCLSNNSVYISTINSFTTFNGTNGNGGGPFIFDAPAVAIVVQENNIYISAGLGLWYALEYQKSADLSSFNWIVNPLKTGLKQGAFSQSLTWKTPNDVAFVTNEPVVRTLGRVDMNLATPQMVNLSAPIVNDVNTYDFTGGSGKFFNEYLYVAVPTKGIIRIYNMTSQDEGDNNFYWEAPQTIPLSGFMDAGDGNIYGHSALTSDTFKLFSGSSDDGHLINAIATFPQVTFGNRHKSKGFVKEYVEGYLSQSTTLTCTLNFIGTNKITTLTKQILGTNTAITNAQLETASIGKVALGKNPIGGDLIQNGAVTAPNFAVYLTFQRTPFFKVQPVFSSLGTSQSWELLAYGMNQQPTSEGENSITI